MKRFLALLTTLLLLAGCSHGSGTTEPSESVTLSSEPEASLDADASPSYDIFGSDRAIAVMIDNDGDESRPHAGLEDAYLLYEMYVEGRATRIMAVFKGADTQKIGPVRSSRHYFLDYALDNDALYAHAGWSPLAMEQISSLGVNNLNGLVYEPTYYWRERKYKGDYHSLYTSVGNLNKLSSDLKYRQTSDSLPLNFVTEPLSYKGEKATSISLPYADFYKLTYKYNAETESYDRFINSEYHSTQSGAKLSAKQIIIQFVKSYSLGDGTARLQLETVGEGNAIFIREGVQIPLTWSRASRTDKLIFRTEDGEELKLNCDGQTYIQVIPPSMNYTIE